MIRMAKVWLLSLLTIALLHGGGFSQTQDAMSKDACAQAKQADAALNKTYTQIQKEYAKELPFVRKLRIAQRAWVAYRDAQIEALYPNPDKRTSYGTVYPTCRCAALARLTALRTEELKKWIDGAQEGDTCSGSIKVKN